MEINKNHIQKTPEDNALGTSLEIMRISGDNVFGKIYKAQIPKSSNAVSSSLKILKLTGAGPGG